MEYSPSDLSSFHLPTRQELRPTWRAVPSMGLTTHDIPYYSNTYRDSKKIDVKFLLPCKF
jgi:hypothetical protein